MYLLLIIIIIYIIYYKYYDILDENNTKEETINDNKINDSKINTHDYSIITGEYNTLQYTLGIIFRNILKNNIDLQIVKSTVTNKNLDSVNSNSSSFGICRENELIETILPDVSFVCALNKVYLFLIVHNDSEIYSISNLKNKKIGVSNSDLNSLNILRKLCDSNKINLSKTNKLDSLHYIERDINTNFNMFLRNEIDCLFYLSGHNLPYILSVSEKIDIRFIDILNDEFEKIEQIKFKKTRINIEKYNTKNNSFYLKTYYTRNILICNTLLETDMIFNITRTIYKNLHILKENMNKIGNNYFIVNHHFFYDDFDLPKMSYIYNKVHIHQGAYNYYKKLKLILDNPDCMNTNSCVIRAIDELKSDMKYTPIK